jgi:hypothetical protein
MKKFPLLVGLVLSLVVGAVASASDFTGFNDAGFKIRGNRNAPQTMNYRSYSAAPMAAASRQSFSYAPNASAAPAAMPANGYRSYSYSGGNGCCCK